MSTISAEDFEGGTAGGAANATNTIFDTVQNWTFQNLPQPLTGGGSRCGHPVSSAGTAIAQKAITGTDLRYSRLNVLLTAYPPSNLAIENPGTGSGSVGDLRITTTGAVQLRNSAFTQVALSSVTIPLNTWARIERLYDNTNGKGQIWVYTSDPNAIGADYDSGLVTVTKAGQIAQVQLGIINTSTWSGLYIDNYKDDNAAKIGPAASTGAPPSLSADRVSNLEPGTTVTLTAVRNGGTGTLAFTQTAGTTVVLTGSGLTRSFVVPPSAAGETLTFTATDSGGTSAAVSLTTLPAALKILRAGVGWRPAYFKVY